MEGAGTAGGRSTKTLAPDQHYAKRNVPRKARRTSSPRAHLKHQPHSLRHTTHSLHIHYRRITSAPHTSYRTQVTHAPLSLHCLPRARTLARECSLRRFPPSSASQLVATALLPTLHSSACFPARSKLHNPLPVNRHGRRVSPLGIITHTTAGGRSSPAPGPGHSEHQHRQSSSTAHFSTATFAQPPHPLGRACHSGLLLFGLPEPSQFQPASRRIRTFRQDAS